MITNEMPIIELGSKTSKTGLGWTGHRTPPEPDDDVEILHHCPKCGVAGQVGSFCNCDVRMGSLSAHKRRNKI